MSCEDFLGKRYLHERFFDGFDGKGKAIPSGSFYFFCQFEGQFSKEKVQYDENVSAIKTCDGNRS